MPFQETISPEQQAQLDASLSVADQLSHLPMLSSVPHHIAMDALLILYSIYAKTHTCCTAGAVGALMHVANDLSTTAGILSAGSSIH